MRIAEIFHSLQGEGLLAGLIALMNDTRKALAAMPARKGDGSGTATETARHTG